MQEYTYRFRIYPNKDQTVMLAKTFGSCRFLYNYFLERFETIGYKGKYENNNYCNQVLKEEYEWLREVDKFALTNSINHLDSACKRKMNGVSEKPRFKKKSSMQSYQTNYTNNNIEVLDNYIKLPKLGRVKAKVHRKVNGKIINAVIKKYPSGKYYCMILVKKEIKEKERNSYITALDMGVKTFAVDQTGVEYHAPKNLITMYDKVKRLQRKLNNKNKYGKNYEKVRKQLAKRYEKCENIRNDFIHQLSTKIINDNQVIVLEDLCVKDMFQEKGIAKVLGDISISKFISLLEYKAKYYGRKVIKINRYFPSSQICSNCGYREKEMKDLNIRSWVCKECGTSHDRDINAASNILDEGLKRLFA